MDVERQKKRGVTRKKKGDVYIVYFDDERLNDETQINTIGQELALTVLAVDSGKLLLNLTGVKFISSAMMGQLVLVNKKCKDKEIKLKLTNIEQPVATALKSARLNKVLDIYDNEAKAIASYDKKWGIF